MKLTIFAISLCFLSACATKIPMVTTTTTDLNGNVIVTEAPPPKVSDAEAIALNSCYDGVRQLESQRFSALNSIPEAQRTVAIIYESAMNKLLVAVGKAPEDACKLNGMGIYDFLAVDSTNTNETTREISKDVKSLGMVGIGIWGLDRITDKVGDKIGGDKVGGDKYEAGGDNKIAGGDLNDSSVNQTTNGDGSNNLEIPVNE